jgi:hypothetical protein
MGRRDFFGAGFEPFKAASYVANQSCFPSKTLPRSSRRWRQIRSVLATDRHLLSRGHCFRHQIIEGLTACFQRASPRSHHESQRHWLDIRLKLGRHS